MSDVMDQVQDQRDFLNDIAVRQCVQEHVKRRGLKECEDCGEPISAVRQKLGATRCLDCQVDRESMERRGLLPRRA